MKLAIRKHCREFLAVLGLIVLGAASWRSTSSRSQGFRFPLVEEAPKHIEVELQNAQAVEPGQGQTVRVAGVEVGRISGVEVENGMAVVDVEVEPTLRRPDPRGRHRAAAAEDGAQGHVPRGHAGDRQGAAEDGGRIPVANTLPDVDPDEIYAALDSDTRPYLKLLVVGRGQGPARARRPTCSEVFRRLEPRPPRPGARHAGHGVAGGWRSSA